MKEPIFIDIEATERDEIKELGIVFGNKTLHTCSIKEALQVLESFPTKYIAGHNFIDFDKKLLEKTSLNRFLRRSILIDTLPISLLLFNEKTFHSLPKNYKTEDCFINNPVKDAQLSQDLFYRSISKFLSLPIVHQSILYSLLQDKEKFVGFFTLLASEHNLQLLSAERLHQSISTEFAPIIKNNQELIRALEDNPEELAYILAIRMPALEVNAQPPKILYDYPGITRLQKRICFNSDEAIANLSPFAKENFGFDTFRDFPRQNATLFTSPVVSQREIVEAGLNDQSFIAILPTGGGKTFTFWLPALIKAQALKTLTVVISPLQALIKDQMESFQDQLANYTAVALSGYLSPSEHADAVNKVVNGDADLLYLAPESLRSNRVFNILKNRVIERFVIDEAHCLSTWGNDFRHDYFYIGNFINDLLKDKPFQSHIPISCFTATAKPRVIEDISSYIEESLAIKLDRYIAVPERHNLDYEGHEVKDQSAKYARLLEIINSKAGSTLIYIPSSTKKCDEIADQLALDTGKNVRAFHSRLDSEIKMQILKDYIDDTVDIVVATTAFGMGVDKPNIENVIHFEVSESLENYAQEAGRGARNQDLRACCPLIFEEGDLDKHFTTLNRSKLNVDEVNAVYLVIKHDKRNPVMMTCREIADRAGWDTEDNSFDYNTKVKTALLELEREEYLERSRNRVSYYANAVAKDSHDLLRQAFVAQDYDQETEILLTRLLQSILGRGKPDSVEIDDLALTLGYPHEQIAQGLVLLKAIGIISDGKDLSLHLNRKGVESYKQIKQIENKIFTHLENRHGSTVRMSELNQAVMDESQTPDTTNLVPTIKVLLKSWRSREGQFKFSRIDRARDLWHFEFLDVDRLKSAIESKQQTASEILQFFVQQLTSPKKNERELLEFSILDLQTYLETKNSKTVDKALLHLHELKILELGQGRFIYYSPMNIQKLSKMSIPNKRYTKMEYKERLEPFYQRKIESVHIVGEYSSKLISNRDSAQPFMRDYFTLSYDVFIKKYKNLKEKFKRPMTMARYQKIFTSLSDEQQKIIDDKTSHAIMILAGPGSGKTKVLVHKIASLVLQEDIKAEQFLMLTYSRAAMLEFKSRLFKLIGQMAYDIDIFTFHGYALQLIGRQVDSDKNDLLKGVVALAAKKIRDRLVPVPYKTVLVLDEYQDINADAFEFIKALSESHENKKRLIAVGDDDQCILKGVNGADVRLIKKFEDTFGFDEDGQRSYGQYDLLRNYRSLDNLVAYSNDFVSGISHRKKTQPLFASNKQDAGEVVVLTCRSKFLQHPAIKQVEQNQHDKLTTAVLAHSNNEVADIYALLLERGIKAKYLLDHQGFRLHNLTEIHTMQEILQGEKLCETSLLGAYAKIEKRFSGSKNLALARDIINDFIGDHEIYTPSLWQTYLEEISSEQFINRAQKVLVSTIHKAKGREFDTVILLAHKMQMDDEMKRLFYVGMTRAKKRLIIITDNSDFCQFAKTLVKFEIDESVYPEPKAKTFVMSLADLNLGFSRNRKIPELDLIAGTKAKVVTLLQGKPYGLEQNRVVISQFSKKMFEKIKEQENKGYAIQDIEIENVVSWFDEQSGQYRQQPLCKVVMMK